MKYPCGTKVKIKGQRHAKVGEVGHIVGISNWMYNVHLSDGVYVIPGRYLEILELAEAVKTEKCARENLSKEFSLAYKKMKVKDPAFAEYVGKGNPRLVSRLPEKVVEGEI